MKVFTDSGYINIDAIAGTKLPFIFIIGGRGTGKTYGAIGHILEHGKKFIYMRRTQSQIDLLNRPEFSPFKSYAADHSLEILTKPVTKYNAAFYYGKEDDEGNMIPSGPSIGYSMALSTISNLRGFDASEIEIILFDEFIKEPHEKPIREEGQAFLNAYETMNRNRELQGKPPIQCLFLANSNEIGNPLFITLGLIPKVEKMILKNQLYSLDYERGIGIFLINDSKILDLKRDTALYKMAGGGDFADMALKNQFAEMKHNSVKPQPIKEYIPVCTLGALTFYKHKSERLYYCSTLRLGSPESFADTQTDIKRFCRKYKYLWSAYMQNTMYFEDISCEVLFKSMVD